MLRIREGGALKTISKVTFREAGISRAIKRVSVKTGGASRIVFEATSDLSAGCTPTFAHKISTSSAVSSDYITATVAGGTGPYSYAWTITAHDAPTLPIISNPSSATTRFTQYGVSAGFGYTATGHVVVTDALGSTASADVSLSFTNIGFDFGRFA